VALLSPPQPTGGRAEWPGRAHFFNLGAILDRARPLTALLAKARDGSLPFQEKGIEPFQGGSHAEKA
jgi:hypothetical protein